MFASLLCGLVLLTGVQGRFTSGKLSDLTPHSNMYTFANFCFDYNPEEGSQAGTIHYLFTGDFPVGKDVLALSFSDQDDHWGSVFNTDTASFRDVTCEELIQYSSADTDAIAGVQATVPVTQRLRPRYWYFALACCECDEGELDEIEFQVRMLNDQTGWPATLHEFGVDEKGLSALFVFYSIFYVIYFFLHGYALKEHLAINGIIHKFILIFTGIVLFSFASVVLSMFHWINYGANGIGHPLLHDIGSIIDTLARILFMALLMFLSEGWTISAVSLPDRSKKVIVGSLSITFILYTLLLLWDFTGRRPERVVPSSAQQFLSYVLISIWVFFAAWFLHACMRSFRSLNPNDEAQKPKRNLFLFLGISYGIWIISLPVLEYIGIILSPWVYAIVVAVTTNTISAIGYVIFTAIIWPTHASKYFGEPTRSASALDDDNYQRL